MIRHNVLERSDWQQTADKVGFKFHTMYGDKYWDESRYYILTLDQVEKDLEGPTEELHQMCLKAAERVIFDDDLMTKFAIPEAMWPLVRKSWELQEPSLYGRFDFVYDGKSPAKMLEYNADTPTSIYETGFWQWLWLEQQQQRGAVPSNTDQFNSVQEKLVKRFISLRDSKPGHILHFASVKGSIEDRGTVQYLEDCAKEAGIECKFVYVEDIGEGSNGELTDLDDQVITWLFKLYPYEFMFREEYADLLDGCGTQMLEPMWKSILSNKALLPILWEMFPGHPNLLPSYFDETGIRGVSQSYVKKPIFAREGANVTVVRDGDVVIEGEGPYGEEGYIYQALCELPQFGDDYTLIGSWVIGNESAGISFREDSSLVTKDMSRYIPHVIA